MFESGKFPALSLIHTAVARQRKKYYSHTSFSSAIRRVTVEATLCRSDMQDRSRVQRVHSSSDDTCVSPCSTRLWLFLIHLHMPLLSIAKSGTYWSWLQTTVLMFRRFTSRVNSAVLRYILRPNCLQKAGFIKYMPCLIFWFSVPWFTGEWKLRHKTSAATALRWEIDIAS